MKYLSLPAFLITSICSLTTSAQVRIERYWTADYYDIAYSAAATTDGGYIITGLTHSQGDSTGDIIVIKTTPKGDTAWTLQYGGPKLEGGNNVIQTSDGGYLVSGHTEDFGALDCDAFLMKLDAKGKRQWFRIYGGDEDDIGYGTVELADGGYIVGGTTASYGTGASRNIWILRTTNTGDTLWTKTYGGDGNEYAIGIVPVRSGGFLAAGFTSSYSPTNDEEGYLMRLTETGDTLWTQRYTAGGRTRYQQILPLMDGGYMLAGFTTPSAAYKSQGIMMKLDEEGREVWRKLYGAPGEDVSLWGVAQLPNGNLMFSGFSHRLDSTGNVYTLTTDESGNMLNESFCGGKGSLASAIAVQGNSSYLVAGRTQAKADTLGDLYYMMMDNTAAGVPSATTEQPYVYPNPAKKLITIVLPVTVGGQSSSIEVVDAIGRRMIVFNQGPSRSIRLDCSPLPPTTYLFRITCAGGNVYTGRFIVE